MSEASTQLHHRCRRSGFTLVELLVVITLIALLLTFMVPTFTTGLLLSEEVVCRGQLKQVGLAMITFTGDNNRLLPGNLAAEGPAPEEKKFYGSELGPPFSGWARGTLASYLQIPLGTYAKIYKCPSLATGPWNSGIGSNGYFDDTVPILWAGARLSSIPSTALYADPTTPSVWNSMSTVLVDEEDPMWYVNRSNIEMQFQSDDRLGTWHPNNSTNYAAIDGSVVHMGFASSGGPQVTNNMKVRAPSGNYISMSGANAYKWWNTQ